MTQKRISPDKSFERAPRGPHGGASPGGVQAGFRVVIITLDSHMGGAVAYARRALRDEVPGLTIGFHAATDFERDPAGLEACVSDIATADIVFANMLFLEPHVAPILPALAARRQACRAMIGAMSGGEIIRLTRMGQLDMGREGTGALGLLQRLRGSKRKGEAGSGARQMAMLRRLPKLLRFIPGGAQDLRAYFLTLQYWLGGSDENLANLVRFLVARYAPDGVAPAGLRASEPVCYPDVGLYHPRLRGRIAERVESLPNRSQGASGTVGLILMRSYVLAGDTAHYDGVIGAMEAQGLKVVPAFSSGLDARPAIDAFFRDARGPRIDALVSLTGFSLVGGPAYSNPAAAGEVLRQLDVPYVSSLAVEFQSLEEWRQSQGGLSPIEATMMIALPEIDGALGGGVYGGRGAIAGREGHRAMAGDPDRVEMLARRTARLIALRRTPVRDRKVAVTLYNFPPNAGTVGTAAHLSVFASLLNTLRAMAAAGYAVSLPESVEALRDAILQGNRERFGTAANVLARIPVEDHLRREPHLHEIEAQWGAAPGKHLSDGGGIFVLGARFGNVVIGVQPAMGYEGDPMRLLFEKGFAPTHAFSAFYRWLREEFAADAVLHFGTHGALEFMPGKQTGPGATCWPDRLIGDLPNVNLYAANNPSEGALAKRRAGAVLVSHLTPPLTEAGLYRGLVDLKATLDRFRALRPDAAAERDDLIALAAEQAVALDLFVPADAEAMQRLGREIAALEHALIPEGLHVIGRSPRRQDRIAWVKAAAEAMLGRGIEASEAEALVDGGTAAAGRPEGLAKEQAAALARLSAALEEAPEIPALLRALDGRFIEPVAGGDILRNPEVVPTGRNIHGFDPFRIPSAFALREGRRQAERLLERHAMGGGDMPRTVAMVLWGTDNLKNEGASLAQALALMGARPRFDGYGRLAGAELVPLAELGRPRIDVLVTLSGIFRDLLPLQSRLIAEAAYLAATAEEPETENFVRAHARAGAAAMGCEIETAALRVFANAEGAYGSNVNHLVESGAWEDEDELSAVFSRRKGFAIDRRGATSPQREVLEASLGTVDLTFQNLDSIELGVTTIDHYFDTLGGVTRAVARARGATVPVFIGDDTQGRGIVRTLAEQVAFETRTRTLNPKWIEGMLSHGHEGVRQIEAHVTNTLGWSATTGQVAPWIYRRIADTLVLDPAMRDRLGALNPTAASRLTERLIEADGRGYWQPTAAERTALHDAGAELEDRLEGVLPPRRTPVSEVA